MIGMGADVASILKLRRWRVIRELDLESIRRDAEGRFRLVARRGPPTRKRSPPSSAAAPPLDRDAHHRAGVDETTDSLTAVSRAISPPDPAAEPPSSGSRVRACPWSPWYGSERPVDAVARAGETARAVVPALDDATVGPLAAALVRAVPAGLRLALARQLPPVRDAVFDLLIEETAKANATYAFTTAMAEAVAILDVPLNLADILILTKNQLLMGYKIALGAGKSGRARDVVGEVVGVVGGGFLFRQAARSLIGLIPMAGLIPKVAIAYTGTWAIGRAVVVWATQGQRVSPANLRRLSRDAAGRGRAFARGL